MVYRRNIYLNKSKASNIKKRLLRVTQIYDGQLDRRWSFYNDTFVQPLNMCDILSLPVDSSELKTSLRRQTAQAVIDGYNCWTREGLLAVMDALCIHEIRPRKQGPILSYDTQSLSS